MNGLIKRLVRFFLLKSKVNNLKTASAFGMYQPNLKDLQD